MASSKVVRDGKPMNATELSETGSPVAKMDADGSMSGYKPSDYQASRYHEDEYYDMSHRRRGKLIMFNHETFNNTETKLNPRTGTEVDKNRMKEMFSKMGFDVDICDDFSSADVLAKLEYEARKDSYYRQSDCLVVAVMTHGEEDGCIWAKDLSYQAEIIWDVFIGHKCSALAGKPKIFIIQACRGRDTSEAVELENQLVETDGRKIQKNTTRYSIPSEADILIAYSSFVGMAAHRNTKHGTWFIQALCTELDKTAKTDDLLSILTKVNRRVANYETQPENLPLKICKQIPMVQSTLTRKVFLAGTLEAVTDAPNHTSTEKLDEILEAIRELKFEPRRSLNRPRPAGEWDSIRPKNRSFEITQTDDQIVKIASALKLLLSDKNQILRADIREDGATILNLVSVWGSLSHDQRCFAYGRLDAFLRTHGKDWEYMKMVTLPLLGAENKRYSTSANQVPTNGSQSLDRRSMKKKGNR